MLDKDSARAMQYAVLWTTHVHRFMVCLGKSSWLEIQHMVAWLGGSPVASNEPCAGMGYPVGQHAKKSLFVGTAKAGSSPQLAEDSEPVNVCNQATVDAKCKPGQQNRSIVYSFFLSFYAPYTKPRVLVLLVPSPSEDEGYRENRWKVNFSMGNIFWTDWCVCVCLCSLFHWGTKTWKLFMSRSQGPVAAKVRSQDKILLWHPKILSYGFVSK